MIFFLIKYANLPDKLRTFLHFFLSYHLCILPLALQLHDWIFLKAKKMCTIPQMLNCLAQHWNQKCGGKTPFGFQHHCSWRRQVVSSHLNLDLHPHSLGNWSCYWRQSTDRSTTTVSSLTQGWVDYHNVCRNDVNAMTISILKVEIFMIMTITANRW